jgi:hypothetical protein
VLVTFLTRPVDEEKLREFVRRVSPQGPGWKRFSDPSKDNDTPGLWGTFIEWIAGCVLVFGVTIGVGKVILGFPEVGAIWLGASVISGVHLVKRFRALKKQG